MPRFPPVAVHDWPEGGKARTWNRFVRDGAAERKVYVFVDGDAQVLPGSIEALADMLARHRPTPPRPFRVMAAMPLITPATWIRATGFSAISMRCQVILSAVCAPPPSFCHDLIGDDSLIGALAKLDLGKAPWDDARIQPCAGAGFCVTPYA
jgi:hypothetical protein